MEFMASVAIQEVLIVSKTLRAWVEGGEINFQSESRRAFDKCPVELPNELWNSAKEMKTCSSNHEFSCVVFPFYVRILILLIFKDYCITLPFRGRLN